MIVFMNSGYSEPPDIVNFLPGPFEFTVTRVHCNYIYVVTQEFSQCSMQNTDLSIWAHFYVHKPYKLWILNPTSKLSESITIIIVSNHLALD